MGWLLPLTIALVAMTAVVSTQAAPAAPGLIAFSSWDAGCGLRPAQSCRHSSDLFVIQPDGKRRQRLTRTEQWDETDPAWSPDGQRLAYARTHRQDRFTRIVVRDVRTGRERVIAHSAHLVERWGDYLAWSPDGRRILFLEHSLYNDDNGDPEPDVLRVARADGRGTHTLALGVIWPAVWSPDSRRVAFVDDDEHVWIVPLDGRPAVRLASTGDVAGGLKWLPDGRLSFLRETNEKTGAGSLWVVRPDGSGLRLIRELGAAIDAAWSPDLRWIAYCCPGTSGGLHLMRADGTESRQLVRRTFVTNESVEWSPDGKRILWIAVHGEAASRLHVIRIGERVRQLSFNELTEDARWRPRG
jgi:Tol biopolymer transport system component